MVSALDSGLKGPGLRTGLVIVLKCYARHFIPTAPFSTQEYKCETEEADKVREANLSLTLNSFRRLRSG